jgi:hypothetical protein
MRICIVGNAECTNDQSRLVDDSDLVIRFNDSRSMLSGLVGTKTDILCLAGGEAQQKAASTWRNYDLYPRVPQIWLTHSDTDAIIAILNARYGTIRRATHIFPPSRHSSGYQVISCVLECSDYDGAEKYILGFAWAGWDGHPWAEENAQIQRWIQRGSIRDASCTHPRFCTRIRTTAFLPNTQNRTRMR